MLVYDGPSALNGTRILVWIGCVNRPSRNGKTGDMLQIFVFCYGEPPFTAERSGLDEATCGGCRHSHKHDATCYVATLRLFATWQAARNAADRGEVVDDLTTIKRRIPPVRLGTHGDPAAVPRPVLSTLARLHRVHTGYTHQWHGKHADKGLAIADLVMLSVDTLEERDQARDLGLRYFRVDGTGKGPLAGEIECPWQRVPCARCGLCNGTKEPFVDRRKSIVIPAHGLRWKQAQGRRAQ